ncbi:MAG: glycosyltransferase family 39 protein [Anaerolineae bacterium]|nr:glycosyltransferase family 39 protein [Anaerolineae bacterium]
MSSWWKTWPTRALLLILVVYATLSTLYAVLTPPWQAPDEPAHYNYVRYLVEQKRFPVLQMGDYDQAYLHAITTAKFHPDYVIDSIRYEFHQPPLYYLLAAPVYALTGGALLPLRLLGVLIGAGAVAAAYGVGRAVFPSRPWLALSAAAFVAFNPQHIAMAAAVQNDGLAELLIGLVLLGLIRWLEADRTSSTRSLVFIGLLSGLGLLTKTSAYITLPLIVVAAGIKFWPQVRAATATAWKPLSMALLALLLPALLLGLPWWARNVATYGGLDLLGLGRHEQVVVDQPRTADFIAQDGWNVTLRNWLTTTFHSFWGQFGWMAVPVDGRIYTALGLLCVIAALGFCLWLIDQLFERTPISPATIFLACSGLLTAGSMLWYNLSFYQAQGRYLFPALIPLGVAWTLGLAETLRRRNAALIGIVLAVVTGIGIVRWIGNVCGDKWRVLFTGAGAAAWGVRWLLPDWVEPWLLGAVYLPLIALCAACPFLFIVPNLMP